MESGGVVGSRRREGRGRSAVDEKALDKISKEAEASLAARRAERAEARDMRLREMERTQADHGEEELSDCGSRSSHSSRCSPAPAAAAPSPLPASVRARRRSSCDSVSADQLKEVEAKFHAAMISNASLDNDKTQLAFQVDDLKDANAELTEQLAQLKKEHRKKCSEHESLRKVYSKLQGEARLARRVVEERDSLIQEYGLVVVGGSDVEDGDSDDDDEEPDREETADGLVLPRSVPMKRVLLTQEAAQLLQSGAAGGSLERRLRHVVERGSSAEDGLRRARLELEEQRTSDRHRASRDTEAKEAQDSANEWKFRVQRAEAEVSSLQANVCRLEALVTRYKSQCEELEGSEEELKTDRRKLQREFRDASIRLEELESENAHLERRFDKLKTARSNLLKDIVTADA